MMIRSITGLLGIMMPSIVGVSAMAQSATFEALPYQAPYSDIKTWHEQRMALDRSLDERVEDLRRIVQAKYGDRGLRSLYHNFEGPGAIDPRIPGVEQNIRLTTSDNPNVARGAKRTQLYANRIHNDPRFQLLGMNTITDTPLGKTDKDIRFRHSGSGSVGRMEVKDVQPTSQRRKLAQLRGQIDKMAWSQRVTGELQCYVNRHAVIPELKVYAALKDVAVYENVATGEKSRRAAGTTSIDDVLAKEHQRATIVGRNAIIRGGAATGIGILLMGQSVGRPTTNSTCFEVTARGAVP